MAEACGMETVRPSKTSAGGKCDVFIKRGVKKGRPAGTCTLLNRLKAGYFAV
jgi:hypothetical protein